MGKAKPNSNNSQEAYEPVLFGPEYGEVALTWDFEADFAPEADVPAEGRLPEPELQHPGPGPDLPRG